MSTCIHTTRLVLRRFRDTDAARVADLIGNLSVSRWLTRVPHPYTEADALSFFARQSDDDLTFAITRADEVIGACGVDDDLGYWLGEPYWQKGYATEAAKALVDKHFATSKAPLTSGYIVGNTASCRLLSGLGFAPTHREDVLSPALRTTVSVQKMALTSDAWEGRA
ncbi:GNAT family N-acetyltransferase [Roseobacter sp. YSTF-M11]|uniref:GNAT family N-acetyltransferase n=1 Tax=Roseobacter insulae TaxID=2859783 RepID=A0A9X1FV04_9RHOB|nr:GNAT family N-acetyltransferase [Roseobacter insulae]MBW4708264.1 GNAT family N-acetyltransferase [Roseobacter insulae]